MTNHQAGSDEKAPASLARPQVSLLGDVDQGMAETLLDQLGRASAEAGEIALELSTQGGDANLARRLVLEIGLARQRLNARLVFLGKSYVYSAGVTVMSAFPRGDRYLTRDTVLLIHDRQLDKTITISGPIRGSLAQLKAALHQVELGVALEKENFRRLIEGSDIGFDEVMEKAPENWYLKAEEALERRLVAALI